MRSAAGKTRRKLQLDLPLDQGGVDPTSSVHSVSSASRTGVTPDVRDTFVATSIAGQPDRPISFPIDPECVVATLPEEPSRETKLPAATDTDTNGNPYHALESDHTTGPREFLAPRSSRSLIDSSTGTDQVTFEHRKALVRAVITAIHATLEDDIWTLDVEWTGGPRTRIALTRPRPTPARPVRRKRGWFIQPATYEFIRDQIAAGTPPRAIADALNANEIPHARAARWTEKQIVRASTRLRKGRIPGVEPPPPLPNPTDAIRRLHEAGHAPAEIVKLLSHDGHKNCENRDITVAAVWATLSRLGLRSHVRMRDERICMHLRVLAPSMRPAEIATRLNTMGLKTIQGNPWTTTNVRDKLRDLQIPFIYERPRKAATGPRPSREVTPQQEWGEAPPTAQ